MPGNIVFSKKRRMQIRNKLRREGGKNNSNGGPITGHLIVRDPRDYDNMTIAEMAKPLSGRLVRGHVMYTISGALRNKINGS